MKRYELIEHTADYGVIIHGRTLKDLFVNAAYAMFDQMVELKMVKPKQRFKIDVKLQAPDYKELLIFWLKELLYQFDVSGIIPSKFLIKKLDDSRICAECLGEKIDKKRHVLRTEIKAVTRHEFEVSKEKFWQAKIIFDV